jgi:acetyl-CoA C-acetyltransferase
MGMAADHVAKVYSISRREQDEYALRSHLLAVKAIDGGLFRDEIVPLTVKTRKSEIAFVEDEHPRRDCSLESLTKLAPTFGEDGTVTAGSASGVSDGAAAAMLMSREKADALGVKPLARVLDGARRRRPEVDLHESRARGASRWSGRSQTGRHRLVEINEAFSSVVLRRAASRHRPRPGESAWGGIALGHLWAAAACARW